MTHASQAERERAFHDALFTAGGKRAAGSFYDATRASSEYYRARVMELARGRRVLEIGCGLEALSPELAGSAREITGIDISPVAVDLARESAAQNNLADTRFMVMNAEELTFADGAFELVFGASILHHLTLRNAYAHIARVLSDTGEAVFFEPLGHNALINLYRRFTPEQRTPDEHPLLMADLRAAHAYFDRVDVRFYHLAAPAAVLFRPFGLFSNALDALERFDELVLKNVPAVRRYAWIVVLSLGKPRKT